MSDRRQQIEDIVMTVAIIGAGISGLVAADLLQHHFAVTIFEANDYLGGHTNTVNVEVDGERHAIDTGFMVFNDRTYPNFSQLLRDLGVASRPTTMGFSVRDDRANLEYRGESVWSLFAQRRNLLRPSFYRMLADILRFHREARKLIEQIDVRLTVGEFLQRHRFSTQFAEQFLLPMGSAIWSCPTGTFSQFPVQFIVEFFHNHGLLSLVDCPTWRVIEQGSQTYVRALSARFRGRVRTRTPVMKIGRRVDGVDIILRDGEPEQFDHVVFACHSDQALKILGGDASDLERETLSAFPYERNKAVLHTDISVLPKRRRAWASWNYRIPVETKDTVSVTYNMNILQGIKSRRTFCVTLNSDGQIDPAQVLGQFDYHHPIFTVQRSAAQARHGELVNCNRTSFCGAYWGNGFHEDGVNSGLKVVSALQTIPRFTIAPGLAGVAPR